MTDSPCYHLEAGQRVSRWPYIGSYWFLEYVSDDRKWSYIKDSSGHVECVQSSDLKPRASK